MIMTEKSFNNPKNPAMHSLLPSPSHNAYNVQSNVEVQANC